MSKLKASLCNDVGFDIKQSKSARTLKIFDNIDNDK